MHHIFYISLFFCLMIAAVVHAAEHSEVVKTDLNLRDRVTALEQEWKAGNEASYFEKAWALFHAIGLARPLDSVPDCDYYTCQLDLVNNVVSKSRDGTEFRDSDLFVLGERARFVESLVMARLAQGDVKQMKELKSWPVLRARYGRLLMRERAVWISMRDPTLDGQVLMLDSTIGIRDPAVDQQREQQNKKIHVQLFLKRCLDDNGPEIDRFMVDAFSLEPSDRRVLDELLALGLYTAPERAKLMAAIEKERSRFRSRSASKEL